MQVVPFYELESQMNKRKQKAEQQNSRCIM